MHTELVLAAQEQGVMCRWAVLPASGPGQKGTSCHTCGDRFMPIPKVNLAADILPYNHKERSKNLFQTPEQIKIGPHFKERKQIGSRWTKHSGL